MKTDGQASGHAHRARKPAKPKLTGRNGSVYVRRFPAVEWDIAKTMAGGHMRLFVAQDGVIIANSANRPKWL